MGHTLELFEFKHIIKVSCFRIGERFLNVMNKFSVKGSNINIATDMQHASFATSFRCRCTGQLYFRKLVLYLSENCGIVLMRLDIFLF